MEMILIAQYSDYSRQWLKDAANGVQRSWRCSLWR